MQFACTLAPSSEACASQMTQAIGYKEDYSTAESLGLQKDWLRSAQSLNSYVNTAQGAPFRQYVFEGTGLQSVYLSPVENYVATIGDFTGSTYTAIQTNGIWSKETALAIGLGLAQLASGKVQTVLNATGNNGGFGRGRVLMVMAGTTRSIQIFSQGRALKVVHFRSRVIQLQQMNLPTGRMASILRGNKAITIPREQNRTIRWNFLEIQYLLEIRDIQLMNMVMSINLQTRMTDRGIGLAALATSRRR